MSPAMFGSLFVLAMGVAITPPGIIALLAFLAAERRKGIMFALGLTTIVVFGCVLGFVLAGPSASTAGTTGVTWRDIIRLVGGLLVVAGGIYIWRQPPDKIGGPLGKALAAVEKTPLWLCFALGLMMVNFIPAILAVNDIQATGAPNNVKLTYFVFFFVCASITWTVPVVYSLFAGDKWDAFSEKVQHWMLAHGNAVLGIVIAIIGLFIAWGGLQPMLG